MSYRQPLSFLISQCSRVDGLACRQILDLIILRKWRAPRPAQGQAYLIALHRAYTFMGALVRSLLHFCNHP